MKPITFIILIFLLVVPVSAIQCSMIPNMGNCCNSIDNILICDDKNIKITDYNPDGSKEHPIQWDIDNPPAFGKGWYYYVSPNRPFYFPYYYPIFINK